MRVRRGGGTKRAFALSLETETKNQKFIENVKSAA